MCPRGMQQTIADARTLEAWLQSGGQPLAALTQAISVLEGACGSPAAGGPDAGNDDEGAPAAEDPGERASEEEREPTEAGEDGDGGDGDGGEGGEEGDAEAAEAGAEEG